MSRLLAHHFSRCQMFMRRSTWLEKGSVNVPENPLNLRPQIHARRRALILS